MPDKMQSRYTDKMQSRDKPITFIPIHKGAFKRKLVMKDLIHLSDTKRTVSDKEAHIQMVKDSAHVEFILSHIHMYAL